MKNLFLLVLIFLKLIIGYFSNPIPFNNTNLTAQNAGLFTIIHQSITLLSRLKQFEFGELSGNSLALHVQGKHSGYKPCHDH